MHGQDIMVEQHFHINAESGRQAKIDDGRYRLGRHFMKTDGNGNDTRGHRSRAKEVEHIENSRADDDRFDQSNKARISNHCNATD
eukprot:14813202-Heterocapsa_arctica.AAC.1